MARSPGWGSYLYFSLLVIFRDEAARMWTKREAEWERERLARERLMAEVLDVRKRQLDDKMEENKRRQQESIESREELLRELEEVQRMTAREKVEEERQRREREKEIQAQVGINYICHFSC